MTADEADLLAALDTLVPAGVRAGVRALRTSDVGALATTEAALVASAVESRRREFATGRALLRELLGTSAPIGRRDHGGPEVPAGWSVSLAHDRRFAIAVATSGDRGLGVDLEPITADLAGLGDTVTRPDDVAAGTLEVFVVKEAVYKAWSRPGRPIIEFTDVRVAVEPGGVWGATVLIDGSRFSGRTMTAGGRRLAVAVSA
ncbi:MAG: hypothetical protein ACK5OX_10165 [Desertimonas sp.]